MSDCSINVGLEVHAASTAFSGRLVDDASEGWYRWTR